jgi:hypothetical protein
MGVPPLQVLATLPGILADVARAILGIDAAEVASRPADEDKYT